MALEPLAIPLAIPPPTMYKHIVQQSFSYNKFRSSVPLALLNSKGTAALPNDKISLKSVVPPDY